ncbi:MAG: endonuclease [Pseudomonadota bacterium]
MTNEKGMVSCALGCWLVAILGGVLGAALLGLLGGWTFLQAVFAGLVIAAVAGALLSWILCKPLPAIADVSPAATTSATPKATATKAEAAQGDSATAASEAVTVPPPSSAKTPAAAAVTEEKPAEKPKPKPKAKAKPAPNATTPLEEASGGTKPETLAAARDGGPDNLKEIKGVGPKLEQLLHSMGFYHFDQIASWGADEISWVDQNLQGFKGRVSRDDWVAQAKILASGGETEFSKKVDKGGVY